MSEQLDYALDLMRRLPPQKIDESLHSVITIVPHLCNELLSAVDQPLKTATDPQNGKEYLLCDYNRDGDSYRSPWTNIYDPPLEDGALPSAKLRKLEIEMNSAFDQYRSMYFDGGVSSVYLWDNETGFAGAIVIKKGGDAKLAVGCWDSIHVIEVVERTPSKHSGYKLTSTVMLWLQTNKETSGYFNLGGSLTREVEKESQLGEAGMSVNASHIANIGRLVEDMENSIRSALNEVYFGTARNIVDTMRSITSADEEHKRRALVKEVNSALQSKNTA